jgi:two-component system, OmpR family, response regulator ArlR
MEISRPIILLVEDEKDLAYVVKEVLSTLPAEIVVAKNGSEAIQIIESGQHFDLVLLDLVLPQISGLEVLRRLRRTSNVKVILSTGYAASFDAGELGKLDVSGILGKPYTPDELLATARRALEGNERQ